METTKGTYVALRVLGGANAWLDDFIKQHNIPPVGTVKEQRRHVTVIYSRVFAFVEPQKAKLYQAYGRELKVFDEPDGRRCLVIVLEAPEVVRRHEELMRANPQMTYDFPNYVPHITLSYDIGNFDITTLPPLSFACVLGDEYVEQLKLEI